MRQIVDKGIVLARTDFGEADRILTILTRDNGKIRAIAKGVRKVKSKLAGGIELFSVSQISYIQGKSEIYTLTSTRLDKHYGNIVSNIDRTMYAYEVFKIVNKITEDNTGPEYFNLVQTFLENIDDTAIDQNLIQLWLNLQLIKLAGHEPNLKTDSDGNKLSAEATYDFDINKMCFSPQTKGGYNSRHIKILRLGLGLESPQPLTKIKDLDTILPSVVQLAKQIAKQLAN